jgi:hypothetical protein
LSIVVSNLERPGDLDLHGWTGVHRQAQPASVAIIHGGDAGYLDLKFQVVAVDYAPPGAQSTVNYSNSAMRGTQTTNSGSYNNNVTVSVSGDVGTNLFGFVGVCDKPCLQSGN